MTHVRVRELASLWARTRGLLGHPVPPPGTGVWIHPCRQVHTAGMGYPIDVVHLGAVRGAVREPDVFAVIAVETLRPWRIGRYVFRATGVVELAAGGARALGLEAGKEVRLILDPAAC